MIDIHSHLLPGIDDGSPDWDKSLLLARQAVDDGITHALMTPHHRNGKYFNVRLDVEQLTTQFQSKLNIANIPLTVFPSQEIRINGDLISDLEKGELLGTDEETRYLLLEFPDNSVPIYTKDLVFNLLQHGTTPIIVHPERNTALMQEPKIIYDLVEQGAITQVTASSLVGTFGKKVEAFSWDIITHGLGQLLASDAHYLPGRTYQMQVAFDKLAKVMDEQIVAEFQQNARNVINGDRVTTYEISPIKKAKFFSKY